MPVMTFTLFAKQVPKDGLSCTLIISIIVSFLAIYFWKSVYHPLQLFDNQLNRLLSDDDSLEEIHSSIPEYDHLLQKILVLQQQIQQMIQQFVNQESFIHGCSWKTARTD